MENTINIQEIKKEYSKLIYQIYNKPRYQNDEEYRKKRIASNIAWEKQRRATDPEYAEKVRERCRERYRNNEAYRERQKQLKKEQRQKAREEREKLQLTT
jgi:hypothetical protein